MPGVCESRVGWSHQLDSLLAALQDVQTRTPGARMHSDVGRPVIEGSKVTEPCERLELSKGGPFSKELRGPAVSAGKSLSEPLQDPVFPLAYPGDFLVREGLIPKPLIV